MGDQDAEICMIGWGGTYGHLITAMEELRNEGIKIAVVHFNYIMPLPKNTKEVLGRFKKRLVCELNSGQFANYLRMNFPQFHYHQFNKIEGLPFVVAELKNAVIKTLEA
jgi:2-oxoglutarate ferredoxin oxidoreductase subunit alpha